MWNVLLQLSGSTASHLIIILISNGYSFCLDIFYDLILNGYRGLHPFINNKFCSEESSLPLAGKA